jgi:hypothetical protein
LRHTWSILALNRCVKIRVYNYLLPMFIIFIFEITGIEETEFYCFRSRLNNLQWSWFFVFFRTYRLTFFVEISNWLFPICFAGYDITYSAFSNGHASWINLINKAITSGT